MVHASGQGWDGGGGVNERILRFLNIRSNILDTWSTKAALPAVRNGATAAVVGTKIYVMGGSGNNGTENICYDTVTNTWSTKAALPAARLWHAAAAVGSKIYVIGGDGAASTNYCYDTVTNTWSTKATAPLGRTYSAATVVGTKIYVIGGRTSNSQANQANLCYDTITDTWSTKTVAPAGSMYNYSIAAIGDNIYLAGASTAQPWLLRYNTITNTWSEEPNSPIRIGVTQFVAIGESLHVVGGNADAVLHCCYNLVTKRWQIKAALPAAKNNHTAAVVGTKIYVMGGSSVVSYCYEAGIELKTLPIHSDASFSFNRIVEKNGVRVPANTLANAVLGDVISLITDNVSGTITEKIEPEAIITEL
jgi:Uncharacterized protein conserved in bacteria